jgi:glycogen debranching enzyme
MARELGRGEFGPEFESEMDLLGGLIRERMWDDRTAFYYDLRRDGSRSDVMSIAAYWALLAEVETDAGRVARFVQHLRDEATFNRPHRVPSLPANHPAYAPHGNYWCGGVWPSANYMVLRGLGAQGYDALAHEIAINHVRNVTEVFEQTGTLWEDYAPESARPGDPARPDFVGWSGLGPIAVLFEQVLGLQPDASRGRLRWDVRLLEEHGVSRYPLGKDGVLDLRCAARQSANERPVVRVAANVPVTVEVRWGEHKEELRVEAGQTIKVGEIL